MPVNGAIKDPLLRKLFANSNVSGDDLYESLKAMRLEMRAKRTAKSWATASAAVDRLTNDVTRKGAWQVATQAAFDFAKNALKTEALSVAYQALDEHMATLLGEDRRLALSNERLTLPSAADMDEKQARRTLNMALMVVAARLSDKVLDQANKDFKSLGTDYKSLIEQRERAANLLFSVVDARKNAKRNSDAAGVRQSEQALKASLSDKDIAYIDAALNTMTLKEFANDMAAQNLALKLMRSQDPKAFADYTHQKNDVVARTRAYLRAVAGVAAFGSTSAVFASTLAELYKERKLDFALSVAPLIYEFGKTAGPLTAKAGQVALSGIAFPGADLFPKKLFAFGRGGQLDSSGNAPEVFAAMKTSGASPAFQAVLFRADANGWLNRVRLCDAPESGRMLDAVTDQRFRAKFAVDYFGESAKDLADDFQFLNSFTVPRLGASEVQLPNDLLGRDHRKNTSSSRFLPLASLQQEVGKQYSKWNNTQLLRLVFSNNDGGAAYATLDLGALTVHAVPTPEAVFAYESVVDACANLQPSAPAAPAAKTPLKDIKLPKVNVPAKAKP